MVWPSLGDPPRDRRVGARPAALDEEGGACAGGPQRVQDRRQVAGGAGVVGVLGVDGEGDACAHSRVVTLPAMANSPGVRPRQRARRQAKQLGGDGGGGRRQAAAERAHRDGLGALRAVTVLADDEHGGAGGGQLAGQLQLQRAGAGLGGDHHHGQVRAGQLQRAMAELGCLHRLGREAGRLLQRQRAHLGGGAGRAAADEGQRRAAVDPRAEVVGGGVRLGQQPLHLEGGALQRRVTGQRLEHGHGADEGHGGGAQLLAGAGVERDVGSGGEGVGGAVGDGGDGRAAAGREPFDEADELGALAGLADADQQRIRLQQRHPEVQQLGGVQHRARAALSGEGGDDRIARVVGAAHAGEQDRARRGDGLAQARELLRPVRPTPGRRGGGPGAAPRSRPRICQETFLTISFRRQDTVG